MGKPCESIEVRLRSVQTKNSKYESGKEKNVRYQPATVLHIINSAKYSFINENLVRKLLPAAFGPNIPAIESGNDIIVELEWHYPGVKTTEVTTHYVLRESRYQITLRKEDWDQPMRNFLLQTFPEKQWRQHNAQSPPPRVSPPAEAEDPKNEGSDLEADDWKEDTDGGSESESDAASELNSPQRFSRTSTETSEYGCTETCVGDHHSYAHCHKHGYAASAQKKTEKVNEAKTVYELEAVNETSRAGGGQAQSGEHDDDGKADEGEDDWLQFEIVDTDSEDEGDPEDQKEDSYWKWSQGDSRWYHKNPDGSTQWFPKLV